MNNLIGSVVQNQLLMILVSASLAFRISLFEVAGRRQNNSLKPSEDTNLQKINILESNQLELFYDACLVFFMDCNK